MILSKYLSFLATKKFIRAVTLSYKENKYAMDETNFCESHELIYFFLHCTDMNVINVYEIYDRCECSMYMNPNVKVT